MKRSSRKDGLVFSTGQAPPEPEATESEPIASGPRVAVLRLEKKGRGGKAVSVVELRNVPGSEILDLGKKLKSGCGVGGTTKGDLIEIQGDQRERLRDLLQKEGLQVKG